MTEAEEKVIQKIIEVLEALEKRIESLEAELSK